MVIQWTLMRAGTIQSEIENVIARLLDFVSRDPFATRVSCLHTEHVIPRVKLRVGLSERLPPLLMGGVMQFGRESSRVLETSRCEGEKNGWRGRIY